MGYTNRIRVQDETKQGKNISKETKWESLQWQSAVGFRNSSLSYESSSRKSQRVRFDPEFNRFQRFFARPPIPNWVLPQAPIHTKDSL